jgi:hypothetical protein
VSGAHIDILVNLFNVHGSGAHIDILVNLFNVHVSGAHIDILVNLFNDHGSVHRNNILTYIQQDATLHSLFYVETALHVSGGASTHHQERKQLYLQHLVFVRSLPLPIVAASGR